MTSIKTVIFLPVSKGLSGRLPVASRQRTFSSQTIELPLRVFSLLCPGRLFSGVVGIQNREL